MKTILLLLITLSVFCSCGGNKSEQLASDLCSCLQEAGLKQGVNPAFMGRNFDEDNPCFTDVMEKLYNELKPLNKEQQAVFMKEFTSALLNTQCAEIAFNLIPYDMMLIEMERLIEKNEESFDPFGGFGRKTEICDCVDMQNHPEDKKLKEDCDKLGEELERRYEEADEQGKQEIMQMIEDCERNR